MSGCPVCSDVGGFHDHGRKGSKHDASLNQIPRDLIKPKDWHKEEK